MKRSIWLAVATAALVTTGVAAGYPALAGYNAGGGAAASPELLAGMQRDLGLTAPQARTRLDQQEAAHRVLGSLDRDLAASSWFDPATGKLTVAVSDADSAARVRAAGAVPKTVTHSAAELSGIARNIGRLAEGGSAGVAGWGVDAASNSVVVSVYDNVAAADFTARAKALGTAVRVETVARPFVQQSGVVQAGDPWWPGNESNCSIAFAATDSSGGRHFVTAGHCTNDANQAAYGKNSSGTKGEQLGTSNVGGSRSVNAREGDMGVVAVNSANAWTLSNSVNTWGGAAVSVNGVAEAVVGTAICKSGNTSHWTCGTVTKVNESVDYGNGLIIDGLSETNACSAGGDSGGAYVMGTGATAKAVGIHSGGGNGCGQSDPNTIFQPVGEALTKWGLTLYTGGSTPTTAPPTTGTPTTAPPTTRPPTSQPPTTAPPAGRTFTSTQFGFIPDPGTLNSPITSTATGSAAGTVTVKVTVSHWCGSDLEIALVAPDGAAYPIKQAGGSCTSYAGGTYQVPGIASPAAGTWTLRVTDTKAWNFGNLSGWSITV
ncbi:proprotein convertase P-domain-containing protein [Longispora sp. K20-0274]|uniref:proprotein convertase P-domain-containing protein n=1 Tax=Longispora sp. K20-0274 TaxID=3088255 RepID=UPI00399C1F9D